MSRDRDRYRVELDVSVGKEPRPAAPRADTPFNIALLGDFRGDGVAGAQDFRPMLVDRDNVDEILARVAPVLRFGGGSEAGEITVRFRELDDFHPDRLLQRVPALAAVWQMRRRLADPRTFHEAALELRGDSAAEPSAARPARAGAGSLLEEILAGQPGGERVPVPAPREDDLQSFVRRVVTPHLVANPDPRQEVQVRQVDIVLANALRALLHHPSFQALEALWRGIDFLTRRLETDSTLRLHLVNVSRAALSDGVSRFREFVAHGVDGAPWAAIAGCYTFESSDQDMRLLADIAGGARASGVAFLAAGDFRLAGCPTIDALSEPAQWAQAANPAWEQFRRTPEATSVALITPRFLLRLPYGEDGEPCESFNIEEISDEHRHDNFLWGAPAMACALLLGESFLRAGWELRPGMDLNIDRLPLHLIRRAGVTEVLPCAETLMSERAAARLIDFGLMPLASLKDQDSVRLVRFDSAAAPAAPLAGSWSRS
jgi:type VI secretion system protein ImpC